MLENSLRALRRRWGLVLVALLAGCAAASATFLLVPPTLQSKAAVLFVPSVRQPGVEGPRTPCWNLEALSRSWRRSSRSLSPMTGRPPS